MTSSFVNGRPPWNGSTLMSPRATLHREPTYRSPRIGSETRVSEKAKRSLTSSQGLRQSSYQVPHSGRKCHEPEPLSVSVDLHATGQSSSGPSVGFLSQSALNNGGNNDTQQDRMQTPRSMSLIRSVVDSLSGRFDLTMQGPPTNQADALTGGDIEESTWWYSEVTPIRGEDDTVHYTSVVHFRLKPTRILRDNVRLVLHSKASSTCPNAVSCIHSDSLESEYETLLEETDLEDRADGTWEWLIPHTPREFVCVIFRGFLHPTAPPRSHQYHVLRLTFLGGPYLEGSSDEETSNQDRPIGPLVLKPPIPQDNLHEPRVSHTEGTIVAPEASGQDEQECGSMPCSVSARLSIRSRARKSSDDQLHTPTTSKADVVTIRGGSSKDRAPGGVLRAARRASRQHRAATIRHARPGEAPRLGVLDPREPLSPSLPDSTSLTSSLSHVTALYHHIPGTPLSADHRTALRNIKSLLHAAGGDHY